MKIKLVCFYLIFAFISGCKDKSEWVIKFCTEIEGYDCICDSDTFDRGQKVFVTLESEKPIGIKNIIGSTYRIPSRKVNKVFLSSKNFSVSPQTYKLKHIIPFNDIGGVGAHYIEFTDKNGNRIASRQLYLR